MIKPLGLAESLSEEHSEPFLHEFALELQDIQECPCVGDLSLGTVRPSPSQICISDTILYQVRAMLRNDVLLRSGLITPEIIQSLLPWVNSPMENHRVTSTAFLAQLMSDPMLREEKFLKSVLRILEERSQERNSIVHQMAVRGLENLVNEVPEKI
ncbi:hypothetical protein KIL84_008537 [Mauremys mutica]|uniref:Uncharacterized protein n=1 Tax=Mauremys mutica TaxID=74926 RepID=A0A9D3X7A7_9SAUR|nr:hypothetical protein KIL84_008537 [Mauremys mutica]